MSELKQCPFCKCSITEEHSPLEHELSCYIYIYCVKIRLLKEDIDESVIDSAWNTRADGWVSVDDELPAMTHGDCVDIWSVQSGRLIDCEYCHDRKNWYTYNDDIIDDVTHWMYQVEAPANK